MADDASADRTAAALLGSLEAQRAHVLGILEGLDDDALRRAVLPTGWTCVALVQHLAYDVEQFWFRQVVGGAPLDESAASGWDVAGDVVPAEVLASYRREIDAANKVIEATSLDAPPRQWPSFFGTWRLADLRAILLHVITETACHAGHLDAARELLDGRTWLILG